MAQLIIPPSATLKHNQTSQFTTGIIIPIWTLYGNGALDQFGLYTAPTSGWGTSSIRVHTSTWSHYDATLFQKNADDSLTKISATQGYYENAISQAQLTAVGDVVEFVCPQIHPYMVGLRNTGSTQYFAYYFSLQAIGEYHPSGNHNSSAGLIINQGDVLRFEIVAGGHRDFY